MNKRVFLFVEHSFQEEEKGCLKILPGPHSLSTAALCTNVHWGMSYCSIRQRNPFLDP